MFPDVLVTILCVWCKHDRSEQPHWSTHTRLIAHGCRDDTVPKLLKQEGSAKIESMQQSSATPLPTSWFLGVAEDCCMLSVLALPSCFTSFGRCYPYILLQIFTLVDKSNLLFKKLQFLFRELMELTSSHQ